MTTTPAAAITLTHFAYRVSGYVTTAATRAKADAEIVETRRHIANANDPSTSMSPYTRKTLAGMTIGDLVVEIAHTYRIGDAVTVQAFGRGRAGVVVALNRSTVSVEYAKNVRGDMRVDNFNALRVRPVDGAVDADAVLTAAETAAAAVDAPVEQIAEAVSAGFAAAEHDGVFDRLAERNAARRGTTAVSASTCGMASIMRRTTADPAVCDRPATTSVRTYGGQTPACDEHANDYRWCFAATPADFGASGIAQCTTAQHDAFIDLLSVDLGRDLGEIADEFVAAGQGDRAAADYLADMVEIGRADVAAEHAAERRAGC